MGFSAKKEGTVLLLGDIGVFILSLMVMLTLRYQRLPSVQLLYGHFVPFSYLFAASVVVFFIAGLYERRTTLLKSRLPNIILRAEIANTFIAVVFFYFIPYFKITPKFNLFVYLFVSFLLTLVWRSYFSSLPVVKKQQHALMIAQGREMHELYQEINRSLSYGFDFVAFFECDDMNPSLCAEKILHEVRQNSVSIVVIDFGNEKIMKVLPYLYDLIFTNIVFVQFDELYAETFDRIPLSVINQNWFLEKISLSPKKVYDFFKRTMDLLLSLILGIISFVFYPIVYAAIKLDDGGDVFIVQKRVGKGGKIIDILKFRSMQFNEDGVWIQQSSNKVTRVGSFLRRTRIDELPQLWSVIRGDLSLIGPRPDIAGLGEKLSNEIPYYTIRNMIQPGLSGWAQINQEKPPQSLEETKLRLAYDFFYIKNRSFALDIHIALKTIKTLLSRAGI